MMEWKFLDEISIPDNIQQTLLLLGLGTLAKVLNNLGAEKWL